MSESNFNGRLLDANELHLVSGGNLAAAISAGVAAYGAALMTVEAFGEKVGKALYYSLN